MNNKNFSIGPSAVFTIKGCQLRTQTTMWQARGVGGGGAGERRWTHAVDIISSAVRTFEISNTYRQQFLTYLTE